MRIVLAVVAVALSLSACGGSSSSSTPEAVMSAQSLTGCTEQAHSDLELYVTRGWKCSGGQSFLWFGSSDAEANWKKAASQFGWAGKSGDGWAIE